MPNHIKNVLKFSKLKPEEVDYILFMIASIKDTGDHFSPVVEYEINFDKIIPQPRRKVDCPKHCLVTKGYSHIMADKERPWFDWYTWNNAYWGTKWGAYDTYTKVGKTHITFVFSTAWRFPAPIVNRLALLNFSFTYQYADEDIGHNCGKIIYDPRDGFSEQTEDDLADSKTFARNLWNRY